MIGVARYNNTSSEILVQRIVYSIAKKQMLRCSILENVGRTLNDHHAEFSRTFGAESRGESTGDESNDCWIHMLEYSPPCWSSCS